MAINVGTAVAYLTLDKNPFSNGLKAAGAELKNFVMGTGEAGGRLKSLGGALTSVGGTLTKAVTLPIAGAGAACAKLASDFETSMAKVNTIAGASKQELASMREEILKTSSDMGMAAKDFAEATYDAISSGVSKEDAVGFTKDAAKLAKAGFTDVTVATDVLTSTINSYGKSAKDATDISNQLIVAQNLGKVTVDEMGASLGNVIPIASALGVKTEELFSSIAVTTAQGIKPAQAITGLKAAMSNIVKPSTEAQKAAATLGLEFDVAAVKTKGWMGFLEDVKSKLEGSAPAYSKKLEEVNKLKAAIESSSVSSKKYKEEIEQEKDKISRLRDAKQKLGKDEKERKKAIDDEIKSIQEHIKTLQKQSEAEKEGAGNVQAMKKELKEKEKELKILESTSGDTLSAFGTMFGSVEGLNTVMAMTSGSGAKLYNESMKQMKENTTAVDDAFNIMMDTPEEKFNKAKVQLQNLGITIGGYLLPHVVKFLDAFSKVLETLEKLPEPVKKSIVSFMGFAAISGPIMMLSGNVIKLGGSIFGTVSKLASIPKIIAGIAGGTKSAISGLGVAFKALPKAASLGVKGTLSIVSGLGKGIGSVFSGIGKGILGAVKIFAKLPGLISPHTILVIAAIAGIGLIVYEVIKHWDVLTGAVKKVYKNIEGAFKNMSKSAKENVDIMKKTWDDFIGFFSGIGKRIADGLVGGLKKAWNSVDDFFKGIGDGIKNTFKKSLGINSPSRVFAEYGGFIMDGLVSGITRGVGNVKSAISSVANTVKKGFKSMLGINSPSLVFAGYGVNIGEGLVQGIEGQESTINAKFSGLANKIKGLGNVRPEFDGLNNLALSGAYGGSRFNDISNNSNKQLNFNPVINMQVSIADTGAKGTEQLTKEVKSMGEVALKDGLIDLFMKDVVRN